MNRIRVGRTDAIIASRRSLIRNVGCRECGMTQEKSKCEFHDPGRLVDGDLELILTKTVASDPETGRVPEYRFEVRLVGSDARIGSIRLRTRCTQRLEEYGGNLSYDVDEEYRGHRYAARGCRLVYPLALRHGLNTLLITSRPDNLASRRTCELMGAEYVDTIETEREPGEHGPTCRYRVNLRANVTVQPGSAAS
jgi:predicted acetyltransferase